MVEILTETGMMSAWSRAQKSGGASVALVPTMGALHSGHLELVRHAARHADLVVVSIFVNPLQFGPGEDLAHYPRRFDEDLAKLEGVNPAAVFHPSVEAMYPGGASETRVTVQRLSEILCGRARPGHFDGVTTVVAKLLNIVAPNVAVFGQKDWQQLVIVRRLAEDLNFPTEIVGVPTVRESSGLALSSRNQYLSPAEKNRASHIYLGLLRAQTLYQQGERRREVLRDRVQATLAEVELEAEYIEVVHPLSLKTAPAWLGDDPALVAAAVPVGRARLIDNVRLGQASE